MNDDLMTEGQAAEMIGWTQGNLRSHRERADLADLAEGLGVRQRGAVRSLGRRPGPASRCLQGLDLVRPGATKSELNSRGLEVLRVLDRGRRPTVPPRPDPEESGARRATVYRRSVLQQWLDRNPAAVDDDWLDQRQAAEFLGIGVETLKTMRYRAKCAALELADGTWSKAERLALQRRIDASPPSYALGKRIRYCPVRLKQWAEQHRSPHPLLRPVDPEYDDLITHDQAATMMGIQPQSLVGYRSRAGGAARRIEKGLGRKADPALVYAAPTHVLVDGVLMYHESDVQLWVDDFRPQSRGS